MGDNDNGRPTAATEAAEATSDPASGHADMPTPSDPLNSASGHVNEHSLGHTSTAPMASHVSVTIIECPRKGKAESLVKDVIDKEKSPGLDLITKQPLEEVGNLLWIKDNRLHNAALDDWDRRESLFRTRVERKDSRCEGLKNEIYQLVGFFSVFQGVVLTAVTQMTQSDVQTSCKKVWSPVLLIGLAWVSTIVAVWHKLDRIDEIEDGRNEEDNTRKVQFQELASRASALRSQGKAFQFKKIKKLASPSYKKLYFGKRGSFWIYKFIPIVATLSSFAGVFTASCFSILCDRGLAPINASPPK